MLRESETMQVSHLHQPAENTTKTPSIQQLPSKSERASKKFALVGRRAPYFVPPPSLPLIPVVQKGHIPPSPPPRRSSLAGTALLVPACGIPTNIHTYGVSVSPTLECLLPYALLHTSTSADETANAKLQQVRMHVVLLLFYQMRCWMDAKVGDRCVPLAVWRLRCRPAGASVGFCSSRRGESVGGRGCLGSLAMDLMPPASQRASTLPCRRHLE